MNSKKDIRVHLDMPASTSKYEMIKDLFVEKMIEKGLAIRKKISREKSDFELERIETGNTTEIVSVPNNSIKYITIEQNNEKPHGGWNSISLYTNYDVNYNKAAGSASIDIKGGKL